LASSTFDFSGETAIVTGAGSGVGRAIALALASARAAVLVNDLNPDRADTVADAIRSAGGRAEPRQADVTNRFQAAGMIEHAREVYGRVHILVNAAGIFKGGPMLTLDEWDWRRLVDVNLTSAFFCSQLTGRVMADEGGGVIVNLASTVGMQRALSEGVGYAASKAGVLGLTRQSAVEYAASGIRVNALCLGAIAEDDMPDPDPDHIPMGRAGTLDEAAQAVLYLCSDAAAFMTGQALVVDGGSSLV
jgi:NAD(P)-dependent dehydrogenase (short-subunit alcohol dehydrogenase family)